MRKCLFILSMFVGLAVSAQQPEHAFKYPDVPESLETLQERSSFFVDHFWERCNMKSIFSSRKNFAQSFEDYVSLMPYADSVSVFGSIERLIDTVKKTPANMITMGEVARAKLYSDSAEIQWDQIYLPFAKAASQASGLSKEAKAQYLNEIRQLENGMVGNKVGNFSFTMPDGTKRSLDDFQGSYILIFVDEPDNFDNALTRMRIAADYGLNDLIDMGYMQVIAVSPVAPDAQWREQVKDYPSTWTVGASENLANFFDTRYSPTFYYLNKDHVLLSKTLSVDNLTEAFRQVSENQKRIRSERQRLREEALKMKDSSQTSDPAN